MTDKEASILSLPQCPICASLLTKPKNLSCTHTFCESCLRHVMVSQDRKTSLSCPACSSVTDIKDGDVSKLPTNQSLKTRALDTQEKQLPCEFCDGKAKAEYYCCECRISICKSCRGLHDAWKPNTEHKVMNVKDILQAKAFPEVTVYCRAHTTTDKQYECTEVCITCKKIICVRCYIEDHGNKGHIVKHVEDYDASFRVEISSLQEEAESKILALQEYLDIVEKEKQKSFKHIDMVVENIEKSFEAAVKQLNEEMESLDKNCDKEKDELNSEFKKMKTADDRYVSDIETAMDLLNKSSKVPLDEDTVIIRDSMCNELKAVLLSKESPTNSEASEMSIRAVKFKYERDEKLNKMELGKVQYSEWKLKTDLALSLADSMNCVAATPDGRMAVGCVSGDRGIEIYSVDGQLQQTVLKGMRVHGIAFLTDGRCVVFDTGHTMEIILNVSLYTPAWEKLDVRFETLSLDEYGDITVDNDDHIYVSYRTTHKIQVFTPAGGKPVREITCDIPCQIFAMKMSKKLLVRTHNNSVRVIQNSSGVVDNKVIKNSDYYVYPALREDDTILIATMNKERDRLSIEHYTSELKHVSTLITDHVIQKTEREWCYLQEFTSGEMAFCTPDRLYIFYKSVTPVGV